MSIATIISVAYFIGAIFWMSPSIQDLASELKSDQRSLGGIFECIAGALLTGIFWPLFALYKGTLLAADFVVNHFPAA